MAQNGPPGSSSIEATGDDLVDKTDVLLTIKNLSGMLTDHPTECTVELQLLSSFAGMWGDYVDVLGVSWFGFLRKLEAVSPSTRIRALSRIYIIQSYLDRSDYDSAIVVADNILHGTGVDDELWLYCKTAQISGSIGLGHFDDANKIFIAMRDRAWAVDSAATSNLRYFIDFSTSRRAVPVRIGKNAQSAYQAPPEKSSSKHYSLETNFPNPFNPSTTIYYQLPVDSKVTIIVYDILGREIDKLVDEPKQAGYHSVKFEANQNATGAYFCRMVAEPVSGGKGYTAVKKLMVLK